MAHLAGPSLVVEAFDAEEPWVKKAALVLAAEEGALPPPREEAPLTTPPSLAAGEEVPPCTPPPPSPGLGLAANLERPRRILGAEEGGSLARLVVS